jgi:hypothetical protein
MVATLVARNANDTMVGSGGICFCQESGGLFCVVTFGRHLASVAVKTFSDLIYFIKKFRNKFSMQCAKITLKIIVLQFDKRKNSSLSTLTRIYASRWVMTGQEIIRTLQI